MAVTGVSSVGVTLGYALETTAGTKPEAFTQLTRINSIGEIALSRESIDSSALEDEIEKAIAGRASTGGTIDITVNLAPDTITEWSTLISAYDSRTSTDLAMWWEVIIPGITSAFFFTASPPIAIPMPAQDQNSLETMTMTLIIEDYEGLETAVVLS